MSSEEATAVVIAALDALKVPYMMVGSFVSNFYGIPRATEDADFVVQLETGMLSTLMERLGPRFRLNPQVTFEMVTATRRYVFELAEGSFSIELFLLSDDAHDIQRFDRRRRVCVLGCDTFIPTVEDAVITKLRWYDVSHRMKDLQDAQGMIAVQGNQIDWNYVTSWCDRHGTRELLDNARQSLLR